MSAAGLDWIRVEGSSMRPVLLEGDEVAVEWRGEDAPPPRLGELVLGRGRSGDWVVHRMLGTRNGGREIVLRGDASYCFDRLDADAVWGRVVAIRRASDGSVVRVERTWLDVAVAKLSRHGLRRVVRVVGVAREVLRDALRVAPRGAP